MLSFVLSLASLAAAQTLNPSNICASQLAGTATTASTKVIQGAAYDVSNNGTTGVFTNRHYPSGRSTSSFLVVTSSDNADMPISGIFSVANNNNGNFSLVALSDPFAPNMTYPNSTRVRLTDSTDGAGSRAEAILYGPKAICLAYSSGGKIYTRTLVDGTKLSSRVDTTLVTGDVSQTFKLFNGITILGQGGSSPYPIKIVRSQSINIAGKTTVSYYSVGINSAKPPRPAFTKLNTAQDVNGLILAAYRTQGAGQCDSGAPSCIAIAKYQNLMDSFAQQEHVTTLDFYGSDPQDQVGEFIYLSTNAAKKFLLVYVDSFSPYENITAYYSNNSFVSDITGPMRVGSRVCTFCGPYVEWGISWTSTGVISVWEFTSPNIYAHTFTWNQKNVTSATNVSTVFPTPDWGYWNPNAAHMYQSAYNFTKCRVSGITGYGFNIMHDSVALEDPSRSVYVYTCGPFTNLAVRKSAASTTAVFASIAMALVAAAVSAF